MRIIGTVVFVLIAGISSSTNAQSDLGPLCTEIGAPNADEVVKRANNTFEEFYESVINEAFSELKYPNQDAIRTFKVICDKVPAINKYRASLINTVKSCLAPDQQKYWIISSNSEVSIFQFTCDNPEFLKDFHMSIESAECSNFEYTSSFYGCVDNVLPEDSVYTSSSTSNIADSDIKLDILLQKLNYNSEACSIIQHFEQCSIGQAYKVCNGDTLSNLLAYFLNYINKKSLSICNIPTLTSVASPGIIVNVLLLSIAVIPMCL